MTLPRRLVCLTLLLTGPWSTAHEPTAPAKFPDREAHRPSPLPDRIVLTWAGDPAVSQAVTWRTDVSVGQAWAEWSVAADSASGLRPQRVAATTTPFESDLGRAHLHTVQLDGLEPATLYAYRVGDGVNWSEWFHFRTAGRDAQRFAFVYFGDAQNDVRSHWSRVFREAFREAPRAAFVLHAGDLINHANRDAEWGEWLNAPAWVNATIPVIAAVGNHEYERPAPSAPRELSRHWRPQFAFPGHGPAGLEETVYWLDYQGLRIVVLNSVERQAAQVEWLRGVLRHQPPRWTIVTFHHPLFSPRVDRDNATLRETWKPVLDEFRVDLVLTGHDHTYARSGVVPAGDAGGPNVPTGFNQVYDPEIGTVYVVSVSGPKMYELGRVEWAVRSAEDTQLFQVITVDGDELRYEARTATGRLYDAFTLQKRAGRPNALLEALPPERRRTRSEKNP